MGPDDFPQGCEPEFRSSGFGVRGTRSGTPCWLTLRLLPNRPQPSGSQVQLRSRLKSGSQAPLAKRPVGSKAAHAAEAGNSNVKRWAPSHKQTRSSVRTASVMTAFPQQAVIRQDRLPWGGDVSRALASSAGKASLLRGRCYPDKPHFKKRTASVDQEFGQALECGQYSEQKPGFLDFFTLPNNGTQEKEHRTSKRGEE